MSKFLDLGMRLEDVIRETTSAPAAALRMEERFGTLLAGLQADVMPLHHEHGDFLLDDAEGQIWLSPERLVPIMVNGPRRSSMLGHEMMSSGMERPAVSTEKKVQTQGRMGRALTKKER